MNKKNKKNGKALTHFACTETFFAERFTDGAPQAYPETFFSKMFTRGKMKSTFVFIDAGFLSKYFGNVLEIKFINYSLYI